MSKNSHTINFQSLKKFLVNQSFRKKSDFIREKDACEDNRIFGAAYHKILEQDFDRIKTIANRNTINELNKTISGFNLSIADKTLILRMIREIFHSSDYQKYVINSNFIHREQNLCHFVIKSHYIFRLEAIIDAIVCSKNKKQIIIDYKTINSLSMIDTVTETNFYWSQLLLYKCIYEGNSKSKIDDLYILFQSKSKIDNYKVEIRKFSELSFQNRKALNRKFQVGLRDYLEYILKYKIPFEKFKSPNSSEVAAFRKKHRKLSVAEFSKYFFRSSVKAILVSCFYELLLLFYHSQYCVFGYREVTCGLIIFISWAAWFVFKR